MKETAISEDVEGRTGRRLVFADVAREQRRIERDFLLGVDHGDAASSVSTGAALTVWQRFDFDSLTFAGSEAVLSP